MRDGRLGRRRRARKILCNCCHSDRIWIDRKARKQESKKQEKGMDYISQIALKSKKPMRDSASMDKCPPPVTIHDKHSQVHRRLAEVPIMAKSAIRAA